MKNFNEFYSIVKRECPEISRKAEEIISNHLCELEKKGYDLDSDELQDDFENSAVWTRVMLILEMYHNWLKGNYEI